MLEESLLRSDVKFEQDFLAAWNPAHLHLILMPTEKCNFRCVYCYEDFKIGRMTSEVVGGVKALLNRRAPDLRSLEINWFGGEPTVALNVVRDIMAHAVAVCRVNSVHLRAGMTTNGYLLDGAAYRDLVGLQVTDYQISLDGPQEFHDATRLRANGRGSFDQIMGNLDEIVASPSSGEILLRVHLTRQNESTIPAFVEGLKARFGHDKRFRFTIQPVENLGGGNDLSDIVIATGERRWGENSHPVGEDGDEMERHHDETYVCYAAKANSFVIRADGRIGKCTVALRSDYNTVGTLAPDGSLALDEDKMARWLIGWGSRKQVALACPAASVFN